MAEPGEALAERIAPDEQARQGQEQHAEGIEQGRGDDQDEQQYQAEQEQRLFGKQAARYVAARGAGIFPVNLRVDHPVQGVGRVPARGGGQQYKENFFQRRMAAAFQQNRGGRKGQGKNRVPENHRFTDESDFL